MKCIAAAVAAFIGLIPPASAQDSRLKAALMACIARAVTNPLPQMLDVDNAAALVYACEGQPALALFTAMELVADQTVEGDVVARRAGSIVCSRHGSAGLNDLHADHRGNRAIREAGPVNDRRRPAPGRSEIG